MKVLIFVLLVILVSFNAVAQSDYKKSSSLTLVIFQSPHGISWKTPKKLLYTAAFNFMSKRNRKLGHVASIIKCNGDDLGPKRAVYAGVVDKGGANIDLLLEDKLGLGVLFDSMPGRLETRSFLQKEIHEKAKTGKKITYIKHLISSKTCRRLVRYYDEFKARKGEYKYGLPNRPRYMEGTGCSAFAMSFFELAGILNQRHYDQWSYNLKVPLKLIGSKHGQKVSIWKFLGVPLSRKWHKSSELYKSLFFWDPDTMFKDTKRLIEYGLENPHASRNFGILKTSNMRGLLYDSRNVPTPTDSIWKN
jgi:hypothetical protein